MATGRKSYDMHGIEKGLQYSISGSALFYSSLECMVLQVCVGKLRSILSICKVVVDAIRCFHRLRPQLTNYKYI